MSPTQPVYYVFIDYENVQDVDLAGLGEHVVKVTLLIGEKQKRLDTELVEQLLARAAHVQLARLRASGKNALDFTLAYYLGRAAAADPTGSFHIVSRDKGFDPLIEHLSHQRITAARHNGFSDLPFVRSPARPVPRDLIAELIAHLEAHPGNRPKRRTTLLSHIRARYPHLDEAGAERIVSDLRARQAITINDRGAVDYRMPGTPA